MIAGALAADGRGEHAVVVAVIATYGSTDPGLLTKQSACRLPGYSYNYCYHYSVTFRMVTLYLLKGES